MILLNLKRRFTTASSTWRRWMARHLMKAVFHSFQRKRSQTLLLTRLQRLQQSSRRSILWPRMRLWRLTWTIYPRIWRLTIWTVRWQMICIVLYMKAYMLNVRDWMLSQRWKRFQTMVLFIMMMFKIMTGPSIRKETFSIIMALRFDSSLWNETKTETLLVLRFSILTKTESLLRMAASLFLHLCSFRATQKIRQR